MASLVVKGTVKSVGEVETFDSGFQKCTVVFEEQDGQYTNDIAIDFLKQKADAASKMQEGEVLEVHCNIRSNESNGRWFTNVNGWKWVQPGQESGY